MFELLQLKRGPVDQEGCGVPQNRGNRLLFVLLRSKWGSCSSGRVWHTAKRDSAGYCSSTVQFLQPPPATVHPPSTSSSLHQLLFIQPSTGSYSSSLRRLPFNQAYMGSCLTSPSMGSCSTSPPRAPSTGYWSSTPTSSIRVLFIQRQWSLLP